MIKNKLFTVEVKEKSGNVKLNVTHNGWHWTSVKIEDPDYEIPLIIEALKNYEIRHKRVLL